MDLSDSKSSNLMLSLPNLLVNEFYYCLTGSNLYFSYLIFSNLNISFVIEFLTFNYYIVSGIYINFFNLCENNLSLSECSGISSIFILVANYKESNY